MTITGTQKFGLAMGILPGANFIASVVKFIYYKSQETDLNAAAQLKVTRTAELVNQAAQNSLQKIEDDIANLKWFALLQIIPLIGIIFVNFEYELLERINNAVKESVPPAAQPAQPAAQPVAPAAQPVPPRKEVVEVTDLATFEKEIKGGKVVALIDYCKMHIPSFYKANRDMPDIKFISLDASKAPEKYWSQDVQKAYPTSLNLYWNGHLHKQIKLVGKCIVRGNTMMMSGSDMKSEITQGFK